jgi:hypothetical protein
VNALSSVTTAPRDRQRARNHHPSKVVRTAVEKMTPSRNYVGVSRYGRSADTGAASSGGPDAAYRLMAWLWGDQAHPESQGDPLIYEIDLSWDPRKLPRCRSAKARSGWKTRWITNGHLACARLQANAPEKLDPQDDEPGAPEHDVERFECLLFPRRQPCELEFDEIEVFGNRGEILAAWSACLMVRRSSDILTVCQRMVAQ